MSNAIGLDGSGSRDNLALFSSPEKLAHSPEKLNPWLLFASLNSPMVKRQIKAKQFTQDIIDTLGRRLFEIQLPLPKDKRQREQIARETQRIIETRIELRNQAKAVTLAVEGLSNEADWNDDID